MLKLRLKKFGYRDYIYNSIINKRVITGNCWIWTGAKRAHYGSIKINGRVADMNRFIVHLFFNMSLEGGKYLACHTLDCSSKACFSPNHLYRGDEFSNMRDAVIAGTHNFLSKNRKRL